MNEDRFEVIIVDRERQERFPRSKKRRIRAKWRKNRANWGPLMIPVGHVLIAGKFSGVSDAHRRSMARRFEMHSKFWEMVKEKHPDFAARCDVVPAPTPYKFT